MSTEIKVGPPVISINQGNSFMVTSESGEIVPERELGVFAKDTRLISRYRFFIQQAMVAEHLVRDQLLFSAVLSDFSCCKHSKRKDCRTGSWSENRTHDRRGDSRRF